MRPDPWNIPCLILLLLSASTLAYGKVSVELEGIPEEAALKNVTARLGILQLEENEDTPKRHIRTLYLQGEQEIKEALQPFGYYQARVDSEMTRKEDDWEVIYRVTLGPPLIIKEISQQVEGPGATASVFTAIADSLTLKVGDRFQQQAYDAYKRRLLNAADQHGYFDARFTRAQILIDPKTNTAQIDLVFNTGKPYYYGPISFQSEYYDPKFLRRFLIIQPGEAYDENQVAQLQANLQNSGFFATSMVEANREALEDDTIPVDIEVTPRKRFTYTAGAGYGTDLGARANLGFQWRRITNTGHSLRLNIDPAQYLQSYSLGYRIPAEQPATDYYEVYTAYIHEQPQGRVMNSTTKQLAGVWSVGQSLNSMLRVISLTYQEDNYIDQEGGTQSRLVLPRATWEWIEAKNRYNPEIGYRARVDLRGTSHQLGSTTEFLQGELNAKAIYPLTDSMRFITRGQFGTTLDATLEAIPPSLRFYAGGDNSVRGYLFESLGVTVINDNGKKQNIGGSFVVVGSTEIEQHIWGNLYGAIFYDTGNASISLTEPLAQSFGIGLRYRTPIGPFRVDFATPISESTEAVRLHITLGPDL
jgi:translocation and assembly module TamA